LTIRPVEPPDVDTLRSIHRTTAVAEWWGTPGPEWPFDDEECAKYVIDFEGRTVGFIQWVEESEPDYRHAGIDLFIAEEAQGKGIGQEAICAIRDYLVGERGHHRITIDPAAHNRKAIQCYAKCSFLRVGVMRSYERNQERDGWHDGLLMEYVTTQVATD
jgi:aminoglycoside 6'-N-acetyltransferase